MLGASACAGTTKNPFPLLRSHYFGAISALSESFCCMTIIPVRDGGDVARGKEIPVFIQYVSGMYRIHPSVLYCTDTISLIFYALLFVHQY